MHSIIICEALTTGKSLKNAKLLDPEEGYVYKKVVNGLRLTVIHADNNIDD